MSGGDNGWEIGLISNRPTIHLQSPDETTFIVVYAASPGDCNFCIEHDYNKLSVYWCE